MSHGPCHVVRAAAARPMKPQRLTNICTNYMFSIELNPIYWGLRYTDKVNASSGWSYENAKNGEKSCDLCLNAPDK